MNKNTSTKQTVKAANVKITKNQVDQAMAAGITHANFTNKGVQKRLKKNQEKVKRNRELQQAMMRKNARKKEKEDKAFDEMMKSVDKTKVMPPTAIFPATQKTLENYIDPASIGGDLVDVDYKPENFGSQVVTQDQETGWVTSLPEHMVDKQAIREGEYVDGVMKLHEPKVSAKHTRSSDLAFRDQCQAAGISYEGNTRLDHDLELRLTVTQEEVAAYSPEKMPVAPVTLPIIKLQENEFLVNLYGDDQNYKPLPEIGDFIRPDGLLAAVRTVSNEEVPTGEKLAAIREVSHLTDNVIYSIPRGKVVNSESAGDHTFSLKP